MTPYENTKKELSEAPRKWLITGVAGFIGSNLLSELLKLGQQVVGVDNLSTGHQHNLDAVRAEVGEQAWKRFRWIEGDVTDQTICRDACNGVDHILHQAALGSVPRSLAHPEITNHHNVGGFVTLLTEAKDAGVKRFVYASSSSVYGDHPALPKVEEQVGEPLSPYAVSKKVTEIYAAVFERCYEIECTGLRYFNVFGPRQDPKGAYAAVIPKWVDAMLAGESVVINGDGETSRDFCYIANVVQANLLAATAKRSESGADVFNVAVGGRTTLNDLYEMIRVRLESDCAWLRGATPEYADFRAGDVRHSNADISKAERLLGYRPTHDIGEGLDVSLEWYRKNSAVGAS